MVRIKRKNEYCDGLRKYKLCVDGHHVGDLGRGETFELELVPGWHVLQLKIDWCTSNTLHIHIQDEKDIELQCGSSMKGLKMLLVLFYITLFKNNYLWLARGTGDGRVL